MIAISAVRKRKQASISIHQISRNRALAREGTFAAAGVENRGDGNLRLHRADRAGARW